MDGRAFLASARLLLATPSEANRRTVAGRAYYALLHEGQVALERWGFPLPPKDNIHTFVRLRFSFAANPDMKALRTDVDFLLSLRTKADYRLKVAGPFATDTNAVLAVTKAQNAIDLLDQIEADPARRAAAVAALRAAWP